MSELLATLRERARALGFDQFGVASVDPAAEAREHARYSSWLDAGAHAGMDYLARGAARRRSVRQIVPGAQSVLALSRSYAHPAPAPRAGDALISRYARGRDYHKVFESGLRDLCRTLLELAPGSHSRWYVDTGPVLERFWAARAGLGWIGKNTCLIDTDRGSYLFLGVVITTLQLPPDPPVTDHCGSCTRCLDACPTQAFPAPYQLDARRCIAYWNVEHRGEFPEGVAEELGEHFFGCDLCQEVCPWNREDRITPPADDALAPLPQRLDAPVAEIARRIEEDYEGLVRGSAMRRARRDGLMRNLAAVTRNITGE